MGHVVVASRSFPRSNGPQKSPLELVREISTCGVSLYRAYAASRMSRVHGHPTLAAVLKTANWALIKVQRRHTPPHKRAIFRCRVAMEQEEFHTARCHLTTGLWFLTKGMAKKIIPAEGGQVKSGVRSGEYEVLAAANVSAVGESGLVGQNTDSWP